MLKFRGGDQERVVTASVELRNQVEFASQFGTTISEVDRISQIERAETSKAKHRMFIDRERNQADKLNRIFPEFINSTSRTN